MRLVESNETHCRYKYSGKRGTEKNGAIKRRAAEENNNNNNTNLNFARILECSIVFVEEKKCSLPYEAERTVLGIFNVRFL